MSDQDHRHVELLFKGAELVEDLFLDRDIERGGGFISYEEFGLAAERHGDHHSLLHPSGELVGIIVHPLFWVDDTDHVEEAEDLCINVCDLWAMDPDGFRYLLSDRENGVEGSGGFLEDVCDVFSADLSEVALGQLEDISAIEKDPAFVGEGCGGGEEASECEAGDTFTTTAFADDGEGFAVVELERHVANGVCDG